MSQNVKSAFDSAFAFVDVVVGNLSAVAIPVFQHCRAPCLDRPWRVPRNRFHPWDLGQQER